MTILQRGKGKEKGMVKGWEETGWKEDVGEEEGKRRVEKGGGGWWRIYLQIVQEVSFNSQNPHTEIIQGPLCR